MKRADDISNSTGVSVEEKDEVKALAVEIMRTNFEIVKEGDRKEPSEFKEMKRDIMNLKTLFLKLLAPIN